jgi:hypothetical protein
MQPCTCNQEIKIMDDTQITPNPDLSEVPQLAPESEAVPAIKPVEEKKPEGIEHDPYEWGKCAVTASIVWLPDGSVMLGVRNHLDAPILTVLSGDSMTTLPGHAAELPLPTLETIAELLAQLREDLPLRAKAKTEREEAARKKADEQKKQRSTKQKSAQFAPAQTPARTPAPVKPAAVGKAPAPTQASLFSMMTGAN